MIQIENITENDRKILMSMLETINPERLSTIKDIRAIDKICTVIEGSEDVLNFEDADFAYLKNRMTNFTGWVPKARKEILALFEKFKI